MNTTTDKHVYDFGTQFDRQRRHFNAFQDWCWDFLEPEPVGMREATQAEERSGLDLVITDEVGQTTTIEVKTEFRAATTGNLVFEVISQAVPKQPGVIGWGFKLEHTDLIAYIVPGPDEVYVFSCPVLQRWVIDNYGKLRNFAASNRAYTTLGVLMPISKLSDLVRYQGSLREHVQRYTEPSAL